MRIHALHQVPDDDRWAWECTCGAAFSPNRHRALELFDEHLANDVTADPLDELALIEAKQRHPSRRRREWLSDDQVNDR